MKRNGQTNLLEALVSALHQFAGAAKNLRTRKNPRSMRLCETLSLGDRRVLALVMVENEKLLVGTAGSSMTLLARFPAQGSRPCETAGFSEAGGQDSFLDADEAYEAEAYKSWR